MTMINSVTDRQMKILVIDDEDSARRILVLLLRQQKYLVLSAATVPQGIKELENNDVDLVITDLKIGSRSGVEILKLVETSFPDVESILLTAYGSIEGAVEAIHAGAFDYVTKPYDNEQLLIRVKKALERKLMREELTALREHVAMSFGFDNIIGISQSMSGLKETAKRIAPTDITVLITGDSGTGKELIARAIHHHSRRRTGRFVAIDCSAIPEHLLESELFGHTKGSFTSAHQSRVGLLEEAHGGTIFFDELSNMPASIQVKLLRFLQDFIIRPVGASETKKVDIRVIGASNQDLAKMVSAGTFRQDLYYRLNVLPIHLPPLSQRKEDIEILTEYLLRKIAAEMKRSPLTISRNAVAALLNHSWPGNVRELENTLKRAAALSLSDCLDIQDITFVGGESRNATAPEQERPGKLTFKGGKLLHNSQKDIILQALSEHNWNYTRTAAQLGIGRTTLWRKIKKFDLGREKTGQKS